jgi:hypothetical protein
MAAAGVAVYAWKGQTEEERFMVYRTDYSQGWKAVGLPMYYLMTVVTSPAMAH